MNHPKPTSRYSCYSLTNQEILMRNIQLLGLDSSMSEKEVRAELTVQNIKNPKIMWFILYHSLRAMVHSEEFTKSFEGWYPPRTVADQHEFKKICCSLIQKLQIQNKIPKNFMLNRSILDQPERIVEFLRYLTEFALRSLYLTEFSAPLTQVAMCQSLPVQDINRYYPNIMCPEPPEVPEAVFRTLETHLELQKKQLLSKSTRQSLPAFPHQQLINNLYYLEQIKKKLNSKIPKEFFSENRAFDRTQILDKIEAFWRDIDVGVEDLEVGQSDVLESEGQWFELDQKWAEWLQQLKGTFFQIHRQNVADSCSSTDKSKLLDSVKQEMKKQLEEFDSFSEAVRKKLSEL